MFSNKCIGFLTPFFLFLGSAILYLHNLSPSVYGGDVGDLVTAAYVGGVAHAPGYPLFTILGFVVSHIFSFFTPAYAVGLISVFSGALPFVFFYATLKRLRVHVLVALVATLTLATNYLFWFYNEIAEVFALHTLFIFLLLYLSIMFSQTKKMRFFFLFLFFLGLSFTHHQTIIFFVPTFFVFILPTLFTKRREWKTFFWGIPFFLLGLVPYVYVPIASSFHPPINWDNVHDIGSFLHLLLRQDYGTFQAGRTGALPFFQRLIILQSYLTTIVLQLTIPVCAVSLLGIIYGIRKYRLFTLTLMFAFLVSGPFFIMYAGFPLSQNFFFGVNERFFTMSEILIFFFFAFGLTAIRSFIIITLKRPTYAILFSIIFLLIPLQLFFYNFPKTNLSHVWDGDMLGYNMLSPLPSRAVLLIAGDTPLFNTWYMHYARQTRPDVNVVNAANMEMDPYAQVIQKGLLTKNPQLKKSPEKLAFATVEEMAKHRPLFSGVQIQGGQRKLIWVPYGLYFQLLPSENTMLSKNEFITQTNTIWHTFHIPPSQGVISGSLTISEIPTMYSSSAIATGAYFDTQYHAKLEAKLYYEKAIQLDSSNGKAYEALGLYYLTTNKNCQTARDNFVTALQKNPSEELGYLLLYATYQECLHEKDNAQNVAIKFRQQFGEDILTALKKTLSKKEAIF